MEEQSPFPAPDGAPGSGASPGGSPDPVPGKRAPTLGDVFWVGTACAISVVAAGGIGYALDSAFGTLPWLTVAGLAFGVVSAVLLAVNQFRKYL